MRKLIITTAVIGVLGFSGVAKAESYISAYAGAAFTHGMSLNEDGINGKEEYDAAPVFGLKAGHWFTKQDYPNIGVQLDFSVFNSNARLRGDSGNHGPFLGVPTHALRERDFKVTSITANFLLRKPDGNIRPHFGIGAGRYIRDYDTADVTIFADSDGSVISTWNPSAKEDSDFGWQALAGIDIDLARNFTVFGEYKYVSFEGASISNIYGGVSYHFEKREKTSPAQHVSPIKSGQRSYL